MTQFLNFSNRQALPLWLLALLVIIPFNVASRFPPYRSFYQDIIVVLLILLLFLSLLMQRRLIAMLPGSSVYCFALAVYWCFQPLVVDLPYWGQNIRVALLFILLGLMAWSVQGLLLQHGRDRVIQWVAWAVVIGVVIQSIVLLLQFSGLSEWVKWFVFSDGSSVSGQFGQRNMLGHYMMWGVLGAAYLIGKQQIRVISGVGLILFLSACLALVGSRTIIAYVLAIALLLFVRSVFSRASDNKVAKILFFTICWVLLAQWLIPQLLSDAGIAAAQSGLERLVERPDAQFRIPEWGKAWQSFLHAPLFGHGWHSYTYQSILTDWEIIADTDYHLNGYISNCHNIVLQILAEMGAIGAVFVFGGLLWVLLPMLKKIGQSDYLWLCSLLAVTACHSLLEFPLWYSYFLTAAMLFLALGQSAEPLVSYPKVNGYAHLFLLFAGTLGLVAVIWVLGLNQWLIQKNLQTFPQTTHLNYIRIKATFVLGQKIPLLKPYGDMEKMEKIDITEDELSPQNIALIEKFNRYLPVHYVANLQGLSLYRQGKKAESLNWMKKIWHYYPRKIPESMFGIYQASPLFKDLEMPVYQACLRQKAIGLYKEITVCPEPSVENLNKIKK